MKSYSNANSRQPWLPTVSVVLSTYNGTRYLREQLDSLLAQTWLPDRIVICDDCSSDGTPDIVRRYVDDHGDLPVEFELSVNERNIGWEANFRKMIAGSGDDYIFPCDQDDIWEPRKIARMVEVMEALPDLDLLACSVMPFYEEGSQRSDAASNQAEGDDRVEAETLAADFMYILRPGCSYCVRGSFVQRILPYWKENYPHDATLWRLAVLEGGAAVLNERLVRFRRHAGNASDRRRQTREDRIADIEYYIDFVAHARCFADNDCRCCDAAVSLLDECGYWLDARMKLLTTRKPSAAMVCVKNRRFYKSGRGLVLDMLFAWVKGLKV